jgi:hypothetical protein
MVGEKYANVAPGMKDDWHSCPSPGVTYAYPPPFIRTAIHMEER